MTRCPAWDNDAGVATALFDIQFVPARLRRRARHFQLFWQDGARHCPSRQGEVSRQALAFDRHGQRFPVSRLAQKSLFLNHGKAEQAVDRSEEHTSELQSLMRNSYAVFCLKKK